MRKRDYLLSGDILEEIINNAANNANEIYNFDAIFEIGLRFEGVLKNESILFFDIMPNAKKTTEIDDCRADISVFRSCSYVYVMLMAYGYDEYANDVLTAAIAALSLDDALMGHTKVYTINEKIAARKGKVNRHHDSALKIAMNTWAKYPNASLAGMTEEIHAYLRSKWNDTPTTETIKSWLKKSNLYPDAKPKNRDFKLIINEEG
ncbi:TPA_asm: hypothetical protein G0G78_07290 [Salmonella enterica]|nr:hypothetical protein [Salmonella enterica]HAC8270136.1 hypothetical protein [Salmonella enterica]